MLVVMTAERGLCGGFNSSIVKMARAKADELIAQGKTVKMITVGKKGREQLKREFGDVMVHHVDLSDVRNVGYGNAQASPMTLSIVLTRVSSTWRRSSTTRSKA